MVEAREGPGGRVEMAAGLGAELLGAALVLAVEGRRRGGRCPACGRDPHGGRQRHGPRARRGAQARPRPGRSPSARARARAAWTLAWPNSRAAWPGLRGRPGAVGASPESRAATTRPLRRSASRPRGWPIPRDASPPSCAARRRPVRRAAHRPPRGQRGPARRGARAPPLSWRSSPRGSDTMGRGARRAHDAVARRAGPRAGSTASTWSSADPTAAPASPSRAAASPTPPDPHYETKSRFGGGSSKVERPWRSERWARDDDGGCSPRRARREAVDRARTSGLTTVAVVEALGPHETPRTALDAALRGDGGGAPAARGPGGGVGAVATAHLAVACGASWLESDATENALRADLLDDAITVKDGLVRLGDRAGHGATLRSIARERHGA